MSFFRFLVGTLLDLRFILATLLGVALSALPMTVAAQIAPMPGAMVEPNPSDESSWGFAASVPVGGSLTWTNTGSQAHTATAANGSFDTGLVQPGASATIKFSSPGIYAYVCSPHPWMTGFVVVSSANASGGPDLAMVEGSIADTSTWGFAYRVSAGSSLTWTNAGSHPHTVTANDGSFDTDEVAPRASASLEFDTPGLYPFVCSIHPDMQGGNVLVN